MNTLSTQTNPAQTIRRALPYRYTSLVRDMVMIENLKGEMMILTRAEVQAQLDRTDLDVHRRRMYEGALEELGQI